MRELDLIKNYPQSKRIASRTIRNKIIASYRDHAFFDGDRANGYGGFEYDGRWKPIAEEFCKEYGLNGKSAVLQLGCEKGFLLHDLLALHPLMRVRGLETSLYARNCALHDIRLGIRLGNYCDIPFKREEFDLVIALGVVYTLNLTDALRCLKEILRVAKQSFITLASYESDEDLKLFKQWTLLGTTILRKEEWLEVLNHCRYEGDYKFVNSETLNLCAS